MDKKSVGVCALYLMCLVMVAAALWWLQNWVLGLLGWKITFEQAALISIMLLLIKIRNEIKS